VAGPRAWAGRLPGCRRQTHTLWDLPSSLWQRFPSLHDTTQTPRQLVWRRIAAGLFNREVDRAPPLYKDKLYHCPAKGHVASVFDHFILQKDLEVPRQIRVLLGEILLYTHTSQTTLASNTVTVIVPHQFCTNTDRKKSHPDQSTSSQIHHDRAHRGGGVIGAQLLPSPSAATAPRTEN